MDDEDVRLVVIDGMLDLIGQMVMTAPPNQREELSDLVLARATTVYARVRGETKH